MAVVDPLFAQWLQADGDYVVRSDAGTSGRWGATAITTERMTGIATSIAAETEADRQLAFFARGPFALETHQLVGTDWAGEIGRVVTITIDELGYDDGLAVLVLGASVDRSIGISSVTVLRPLRGLSESILSSSTAPGGSVAGFVAAAQSLADRLNVLGA